MRVIDMDTGDTLQAANDDDLFRVVREQISEDDMSDDEIRRLIEERAYSATDS
jgi:hypothetical protein